MGQHLTRKDVEKIEAEIEMRRVELRPKLTAAVAEAAAQGDRSENFEYYAAKKENGHNNSRINYLKRVLRTATIVDDAPADEVGVDTDVTVWIPEDEEEDTYTLVTPIRADSLNNIVSIESPIGRALVGHKVGDTVTVQANKNYSYQLEIRDIRPSERAGELDISKF
ncbi:transcription elongation factor GreA [Lachnospiraceae bacterium NK3A20]|jgi:transcription elongation factor GreA|nr:transcription elongation factor GreA [Lachnospiraceae bacterium NK3A20]